MKAGRPSSKVHQAAEKVFSNKGYPTEKRNGEYVGFIHSTGHGLGLEVHEEPRVSIHSQRLRAGQVITVEPGLSILELGAAGLKTLCRLPQMATTSFLLVATDGKSPDLYFTTINIMSKKLGSCVSKWRNSLG